MGELIFHSGLGLDAVNVLDKWLGKLGGRLSILAIIMGVIIGALSGSTIATCALLGTILLPDMLKRGYSKHMSLGPLMGVGTVDALIPPNALTVVLASLAMIDVGQLLIAGILPGIIMSGLYLIYVVAWAHIRPHEAPIYDVPHVPVKEKVMATVQYLLPLGFIIFMVIGLIFLGVATPTEVGTGTLYFYPCPSLWALKLGRPQEVRRGNHKSNNHDLYDHYRVKHLRRDSRLYRCCLGHDELHNRPPYSAHSNCNRDAHCSRSWGHLWRPLQ